MFSLHFKVKFDEPWFAASSMVTIDFKLAGLKLESSEAYLLKLKKNLPLGLGIINIFL